MQYRPLGPSNLDASVIGLGAWAMGGWMWGGTDEDASIRAVHASIDAGVNLIDTAPIYGFGLSEEIVGKAIEDRRDRVLVATKCSMVCTDREVGEHKFNSTAFGPDPDGQISIRIILRPESIRREVEGSLRRLRTDHIDLFQPHWQEGTTPIADTMGTLLDLEKEGKIRAIGVCNTTGSQLAAYREVGQLDSDQEKYSMLDRNIEADQLPYCRDHGLAVLAYSPMARGLLTGKMGPDRVFPEGDDRRDSPRFRVENRRRVAALLERIRPIADGHGITSGQLAIAWTLHQPGLTHALCGARNPEQARENAAAGDVSLTDEELARIDEALQSQG